ncbi:sigma-54-dependent Fis family transcriptional regulator [Rubrivivax benzoatilyticus]|uniref:Sigma-54-dependent Fis family transcriptional regulator n=1 Tax=Rubrivivax benzoatilyticus TaxID=316997 RepID=A0ABX0HW71_9BURK|nr:sigma-54-dependent Fis family transcriptional regulator [Rubrivivax benzoatilyticus]EGJ12363.1 sigma-54 dependent transcriptional regulator [Rubrivivax benzoatilyticus JA2 = ATCC BAA-35]NHK99269.1 sigma-54-dependent Fis family transcriptional regulator [Rubrivivax benzoatilyticus]NHL24868.1 sigma-54-dependent Fis family transcriptional regulator [Rubrivivax benzoatilyticus]
MPSSLLAARTPPARLREARRRFFDTGELADDAFEPALTRSWRRSRDFGLAPSGRFAGAPHASSAQLARALDRQHEFVAHARPVMEFLFDQTRDTDSMVILADAQGMLLHALGDAGFVDRAQRVALRPGASWHEQWRGTNAVGTAIAEGAPVVVHGSEHYLERNAFLTCTAAPIADPAGRLLGVLDISGDHRGYHRHTLALVRSAARIIEHRLFDTRHAAGLRLRLHAQPEGLGTVTEGLLAVSEDGWIVGANGVAMAMLGLTPGSVGALTLERVLPLDIATLAAWSRGSAAHAVRRDDGSVLWLRVEGGRSLGVRPVAPAAPAVADALARLDTGDHAMQAAIGRARRVLDKPISLLLQGESGVGKELFARAVHRSSARRDAPFVAVNCAALPETLIEAELFGYRPGAFTGAARDGAPGRIREAHGGTLFLDEIGDMPAALQTRLLRVLQEREVVPLGGGRPQAVDFRLICATHRNLREAIDAGRFREDLYYRLNGLALQLPPLRQRGDQAALVAGMLRELLPARDVRLAPEVAQAFARHRWPGNLRQLHNALATACALLDEHEDEIGWGHLSDDLAEDLRQRPAAPAPVADAVDLRSQSERTVRQVIETCAGNLSEAARRLGISRNTLYRKMRELRLR